MPLPVFPIPRKAIERPRVVDRERPQRIGVDHRERRRVETQRRADGADHRQCESRRLAEAAQARSARPASPIRASRIPTQRGCPPKRSPCCRTPRRPPFRGGSASPLPAPPQTPCAASSGACRFQIFMTPPSRARFPPAETQNCASPPSSCFRPAAVIR